MSYKVRQLRAPTLFLVGRTLRLALDLKLQLRKLDLSNSEDSNKFASILNLSMPISKWSTIIVELIKSQQQLHSNDDSKSNKTKKSAVESTAADAIVDEDLADMDQSGVDFLPMPLLSETANLKQLLVNLSQHEAQSAEFLLQALSLAFAIEEKRLARSVIQELIELLGRFDSLLTSQLIALYQSCSNAIAIEAVIKKSSIDPKNSLLTGYLHQMSFLKKINVKTNMLNSPVAKQLLDATRASFNAFKYLTVNASHFTLQQSLPNNYTLFVMQHNQFKTEIYATILSKSLGGAGNFEIGKIAFLYFYIWENY